MRFTKPFVVAVLGLCIAFQAAAAGALRTQNTGSANGVADVTTTLTGVQVASPVLGAGSSVTNVIAFDIAAQTAATGASSFNVGLRIAAPSGANTNTALYLSGTGGTASTGILFGLDTNLYRSAANTLKTDDGFFVDGSSDKIQTIIHAHSTQTGNLTKWQ